ncbi:MAG TPA: MarR family winged helix-turn-helix transcriptional regulator [Pyrinomonadaceae bacterium]|nr:MarR family transcriptional regulator [Blastocatellia bacterium]HRJ88438.1 MarR family winged helix-turn-helix transcriptional regulator [Pyrinomonadaceae bacterium]HRK51331.1 MarR family winged helix-turn-helix transcriptional regulator [Pyrinomonadaceae bacterium]
MKSSPFDLTNQSKSVEGKIVASLERVSQAFRVLLWNQSKEFSLSPIQVQVLIFLLHHSSEKRKVSYLADEFNMTKATISDCVKTLEQKQLIAKEYEPHDTRSYIIQLTESGEGIAKKTSFFADQIQIPIDKLPASAKEILLSGLMDIIRHLNQTGIITIQRMCSTCQFYNSDNGHFCRLLNQKLAEAELRTDCEEHIPPVKAQTP